MFTIALRRQAPPCRIRQHEGGTLLGDRARRGYACPESRRSVTVVLVLGDYVRAETLHKQSLRVSQDLGDKLIASESLEGLACTAEAKGDAERTARLFGAAEALRESVGYQQEPRQSALREPYLEAARSTGGSSLGEGVHRG
jgi:hypothetical protein